MASTNGAMNKEIRIETLKKTAPLYILETFFSGVKDCTLAMNAVGNGNFLLDSGGFSYMNGAKATLKQMNDYVERYAQFILENNVKYYFEIDVDSIFGLTQVERWRDRLESVTGRQCIPVWHKGRGVEYWKQMCREYSYIAIGGLVLNTKRQEYGAIQKMVEYACARDVKVHGLGFTKTKELHNFPFFSVDSASWALGATRGQQVHVFKDGVIVSHRVNNCGYKVNLSKLAAHNFTEWVKYQKYMNGVMW